MAFAIKAEVRDPLSKSFVFAAQKTMYGGKHIGEGDTVFVFASENEGGQGLIARCLVTSAKAIAKRRGLARQTPRVSIAVKRTALAKQPLGRNELRPFVTWKDGRPETELNLKFYRQATNKIVVSRMKRLRISMDSSGRSDPPPQVPAIGGACARCGRGHVGHLEDAVFQTARALSLRREQDTEMNRLHIASVHV